ncbi:MAG: ferredoxin [Candidatus Omnitrophica bacterium]|nr:ferredoxin [Candidatus Omnitrophota bacterium]
MAKVSVDRDKCVGCGLCEQSCPEVFEIKDDGVAHVKAQSCNLHDLKEIAQQCPVEAIKTE